MPDPSSVNTTLADALDARTVDGELYYVEDDGRLRCVACGHRCLLRDGKRGVCQVRYNEGGRLKVPHGYVAALQCDPVEKKPFFHLHPGSDALTFGMMGCDFHCSYCQNWVTSQALRDPAAQAPIRPVTADELVKHAREQGARVCVSSYNEPLITAEWAVDVFKKANPAGLTCGFVSNGNATPEALDYLAPHIRGYKVDLKTFNPKTYAKLGGVLDHVTDTIRMVRERDLWTEVVTLLIPGENNGDDELKQMADFIASVDPNIPWHVTAYHPDYQMEEPRATTADDLLRACEIGTEAGLKFIYAGNLPGRVGRWEDTRCPECDATLIERTAYLIESYRLNEKGECPDCGHAVPGVWPDDPADVTVHPGGRPSLRMPRIVR